MNNIPEQITNFYQQLELLGTFDRWEQFKQLKPLTDMFEYEWNEKLMAEHSCLRFYLQNGNLESDFYSVDENGKEVGVLNLETFNDKQINYLKQRAKETSNPLLTSRYSHILFDILKNREFGIIAISAYKEIIDLNLKEKLEENILPSVEAIINLTENLKFEKELTKKELVKLIDNENISIYDRHQIICSFINSSLFKSTELKFFPELSLKWIEVPGETNKFLVTDILNNAIKICVNNGIKTSLFYEKLAENEIKILPEHPNKVDFIRLHILGDIIEYYKKAKNEEEYQKYIKLYTETKSHIELQLVDLSLNEQENKILNEEVNRKVKIIINWEVDTILNYFSIHSKLFPDIESLIKASTENFKKSFLSHASTCSFDINTNIKSLSDEENLEKDIYYNYQYSLAFGVLIDLFRVLQVGTYNKKITYFHIYDYLNRNSWYGQNIAESKMRGDDEHSNYKWLNLMAPSLHSLFIQIESSYLIGKKLSYTNWILPIDSLTLKFEGALRDFVKIIGGQTSIIKRVGIQEMLLEDLLNCETVKNEFSKDDLTLFKMIFMKNGDNIRNDVAHGFYHPNDYTMEKACKIFLCILRLGKYKLILKVKK